MLTEKQQQFVVNKAAGIKNAEAAIAAGYARNSAGVTAAQLLKRQDIKQAIVKAKRGMRAGSVETPDAPEDDLDDEASGKYAMPKAKYTDAKEFLTDAMNHPKLPIAARADYAKALLPYQHARIGEKGKKAGEKEAAQAIAGTEKRSKFAKKAPPRESRMSVN